VHHHAAIRFSKRVDHDRDGNAAALDDLQLHLEDRALDLQQRIPVRLVEEPAAYREQILKPALADELARRVAEPLAEESVGPEDRAVGRRAEQSTGRRIQRLERLGRDRGRTAGRLGQSRSFAKKASMADEHALGALRWGQ
jgi:hypothetical protein